MGRGLTSPRPVHFQNLFYSLFFAPSMAKLKKKIDPGQLNLFDILANLQSKSAPPSGCRPASFNIDIQLRETISLGLKKSPLSRYQIAARMSELLGVEITKAQLDSWTAESKESHRFPAAYLPAYCEATGDKEPICLMAELLHCYIIENREALLIQLGKIKHEKKELGDQERTIYRVLKEMK
jgi:hypothetical protein